MTDRFAIDLITTPQHLALAHQVRLRVFVDEQHAPLESEIDEKDPLCTHWLLMDRQDNKPAGTIRILISSRISTYFRKRMCFG